MDFSRRLTWILSSSSFRAVRPISRRWYQAISISRFSQGPASIAANLEGADTAVVMSFKLKDHAALEEAYST